jgi:hypothetical protein
VAKRSSGQARRSPPDDCPAIRAGSGPSLLLTATLVYLDFTPQIAWNHVNYLTSPDVPQRGRSGSSRRALAMHKNTTSPLSAPIAHHAKSPNNRAPSRRSGALKRTCQLALVMPRSGRSESGRRGGRRDRGQQLLGPKAVQGSARSTDTGRGVDYGVDR